MDVSNALTKVFSRALRIKASNLRVSYHRPDGNSLWHWIISVSFYYQGTWFRAGSVETSKCTSIVKALVECGEAIVAFEDGVQVRCGLAGGVFMETAVQRARCELLERDAFLYHYRGNLPFTRIVEDASCKGQPCFFFRMETRDTNSVAVFATDQRAVQGAEGCLYFGASCDESAERAIKKAFAEYAGIYFNHREGENRCEKNFDELEVLNPAIERHHASTRDERNRTRIKFICSDRMPRTSRDPIDVNRWVTREKLSPVRGFRFVRAFHPDLVELEFGKPEPWASGGKPVYHPYY